jgi:hypothetical protein
MLRLNSKVIPGYFTLSQLSQISAGYVVLCQIRSGYVMLIQVIPD